MSRGQTWTSDEIRALLEIWSDQRISKLLMATNKTQKAFVLVSEEMVHRGFDRTAHQCHIKVKRLRQHYIKVRESIRKNGTRSKEKQKSEWFDQLDAILGSGAACAPSNVVESFKQEEEEEVPGSGPGPDLGRTEEWTEPFECSVSLEDNNSGIQNNERLDAEESDSATSSVSPTHLPEKSTLRRVVPGARSRKRKPHKDQFYAFLEDYLQQRRETEEADQSRHEEEMAAFHQYLSTQQEAEERRFKALQEQQQANNQLLLQLVEILSKTVTAQTNHQSHDAADTSTTTSRHAWTPPRTAAATNTQSSVRPVAPQHTVTMAAPTTSSRLQSVNKHNNTEEE